MPYTQRTAFESFKLCERMIYPCTKMHGNGEEEKEYGEDHHFSLQAYHYIKPLIIRYQYIGLSI